MKNIILKLTLFTWFLLSVNAIKSQNSDFFFKDSANHKIKALNINTDYSDMAAYPLGNTIIFMSNRSNPRFSSFINHQDPLTRERFYTLYYAVAENLNNAQFESPRPYHKELKVKYNSGPVAISKDQKTMFVTRNVLKKSETDKQKEEGKYVYILQIFQYTYNKKKNKWENETFFPYNSVYYNCAHAFLSSDGTLLYFSSDMPGGYGGMDIYMSEKQSDNTWGKPVNMGNIVNSASNELFPSLSPDDGCLYFSSDKKGGLGGLDIYVADPNPNAAFPIKNIGYPVNSPYDDFSLVYYKGQEEGYFTSNRPLDSQKIEHGKDSLNDNIYQLKSKNILYNILIVDSLTQTPLISSVDMTSPAGNLNFESGLQPYVTKLAEEYAYDVKIDLPKFGTTQTKITPDKENPNIVIPVPLHPRLEGNVQNQKGELLANVEIKIMTSTGETFVLKTDKNGYFSVQSLNQGIKYAMYASLGDVYSKDSAFLSVPVNPADLKPLYQVAMQLQVVSKFTLSASVLFDLDKYNLRPQAKEELDKIIPILKDHPNIDILLEGHTDSRASAAYNQKLSERRAESVKEYLVAGGVNKKRIAAKGFGFKHLLNKCAKGVKCSEEEHQQNRRVVFVFTEK